MEDFKKINIKLFLYLLVITIVSFYVSLRKIPSMADDISYLNYVSYAGQQLFSSMGGFSFLVSEPLWLFINYLFGLLFEPIVVVRIVIFSSVFITLFIIGKLTQYSFISILFYVLIDQVVKNNIIHLRQGLALSIFLLGMSLKGKWRMILLLPPLIHTSFWFTVLLYLYEFYIKKVSLYFKIVYFSLFSIVVVVFLPIIANFLGDRRADSYQFSSLESASGYAFIWWTIFLMVYLIGVKKNEISRLSIYGLLFYLITYFSLDFSARIFENFLVLILISSINSNKVWKLILLSLLFFYAILISFPAGPLIFRIY